MNKNELMAWGWNSGFQSLFNEKIQQDSRARPARIVAVHRTLVVAVCDGVFCNALVLSRVPPLAVGDWVLLEPGPAPGDNGVVVECLPRSTLLSRNAAGRARKSQPLAANVDVIAIVMACGGDFNPARLDRFLVAAKRAVPQVVVVLTKSDLVAPEKLAQLRSLLKARGSVGLDVVALCAPEGRGLEELRAVFRSAHPPNGPEERAQLVPTVALLGASGVGKSTLTNALLAEERMQTQAVGAVKDRGRHTTTHRELFPCPGGFLLLDSPGIRELQLESNPVEQESDEDAVLSAVFDDVLALGRQCRWRDCSHSGEEGCAVQAALELGELSSQRLAGFEKMRRELAFHARKTDARAASEEKQKWKARSKEIRRMHKGS